MYTFRSAARHVLLADRGQGGVCAGDPRVGRTSSGSCAPAVLQVKPNDYVLAARALGARPARIVCPHVLPNAVAPVIVVAHHQPRHAHRGRGDAVLPGHRAAAARDLLGHRDLDASGLGYCGRPAPAALPVASSCPWPCSASSCSATSSATPSTRSCGEDPMRRRTPERPRCPRSPAVSRPHLEHGDGCCSRSMTCTSSSARRDGIVRAINGVSFRSTRARRWPSSASPARASR